MEYATRRLLFGVAAVPGAFIFFGVLTIVIGDNSILSIIPFAIAVGLIVALYTTNPYDPRHSVSIGISDDGTKHMVTGSAGWLFTELVIRDNGKKIAAKGLRLFRVTKLSAAIGVSRIPVMLIGPAIVSIKGRRQFELIVGSQSAIATVTGGWKLLYKIPLTIGIMMAALAASAWIQQLVSQPII